MLRDLHERGISSDKDSGSNSIFQTQLKLGDKFKLKCGHEGRVVWVNEDRNVIGVVGARKICKVCWKRTATNRTPNVYLISMDEVK